MEKKEKIKLHVTEEFLLSLYSKFRYTYSFPISSTSPEKIIKTGTVSRRNFLENAENDIR